MHKRVEIRRDNYIPTVQFEVRKGANGRPKLQAKTNGLGRSHFGNPSAQRRSANTHPGKRNKYKKSYARG